AKELFGDAAAVGNVVLLDIGGAMEEFTVVGVYRARQTPLETALAGGGGTRRGFIPYTLLTKPGDSFEMIQFFGKPGTDMGSLGASLVNYLEKRKKIPEGSLSVMSAQEEMETWDTALAGMSAAVGGIAAISLLVGGIGIMNIMLVSVTQRTREIGIRKALGAKPGDLLVQFLTESAVLSGMGGVMGVCLGVGIAWVGGALVHMEAVVRPGVVLAAVGFSAGVGAFFGLYPAMQAAKSDPIEALRYE
ncbi:MAG: FtsX-like permease family protein, partial [Lachnospiraceae bacterium]|nr:FtsX-like permease family protein [Lachnospiraceae bacterium]